MIDPRPHQPRPPQALTALLALSAGLLAVENLYGLVAGAIVATAAAVGIHESNAREAGKRPRIA